ncbi:BA75_05061T0 [Komagataella pastoris]|uniref:BA75_05061T0 n=1 Tax=Komagataella pastoris TaxID=4922 RepID=A0A1B2JIY9_PICPA|nr:BA75_05061T0 [Komagataella pastoris]
MEEEEVDTLGNRIATASPSSDDVFVRGLPELPSEVLVTIFSFLDPMTLDGLSLVCKRWKMVINDNELWRENFIKLFGSKQFQSLTRSTQWRTELLMRKELAQRWIKGKGMYHTYAVKNGVITDIAADFRNDKLVLFSKNTGDLTITSLRSNKGESPITGVFPNGTTSCELSKNAMIFGRWDGKVYLKLLNQKNVYLNDSISLRESTHEGIVTVTKINKDSIAGKHGSVRAFSGDHRGRVIGWDLKNYQKVVDWPISNASITNIESNYQDCVIVRDQLGIIYIIDHNLKDSRGPMRPPRIIKTEKIDENATFSMQVDFGDENIVISYENKVRVYSYSQHKFGHFSELEVPEDDQIYRTVISQMNLQCCRKDDTLAGHDGLLCGTIFKSGKTVIWNVRSWEDQQPIPIIHVIVPKFQHYVYLNEDSPRVVSLDINSSVIIFGSHNSYCSLYDAVSGDFMRFVSRKLPRKILFHDQVLPVTEILLDKEDNFATNGVIIMGNIIQYFQFGEQKNYDKFKKKMARNSLKRAGIDDRKIKNRRHIKDDVEDFTFQQIQEQQKSELLDKYNGDSFEDEDEELSIAIALSESLKMKDKEEGNAEEDDELKRALELSRSQTAILSDEPVDDLRLDSEDHDLKYALDLSKRGTQLANIFPDGEGSSSRIESDLDNTSANDDELELALKLSLIEH